MTNDEQRLFNERAERLESYRQRIAQLEAELAEARKWKDKWATCERWRKFYQEAKGKLYAMGGEVADACWNHMPCNESQVDQWFRAEYVYKAAYDRVSAELAEARRDGERLDWCSKHGAMAVEWWQGGYRVVTQHNVWMTDVYDTARAAIDAARGAK